MLEKKNYLLRRWTFLTQMKIEFLLQLTSSSKVLKNVPGRTVIFSMMSTSCESEMNQRIW